MSSGINHCHKFLVLSSDSTQGRDSTIPQTQVKLPFLSPGPFPTLSGTPALQQEYKCSPMHQSKPHHIAVCCVQVICQAFQSKPLHWQLGGTALAVVVSTVDLLRQSKVCNTHVHVLIQPVGKFSQLRKGKHLLATSGRKKEKKEKKSSEN